MSLLLAAGSVLALAGTARGSAIDTGQIAVARALSGASAATSRVGGALTVVRGLGGQSSGTSGDAGTVQVARGLGGSAQSVAADTGDVVVARAFGGVSTPSAQAQGDVTATRALGGTAQAVSQARGELLDTDRTAGTSQNQSSGRGTLLIVRTIEGVSHAASGGRGQLDVASPVIADPAGTAQVFGRAYGMLEITIAAPRATPARGGSSASPAPSAPAAVAAASAWGSLATWLAESSSGAQRVAGNAAARSPADPRAGLVKQLSFLADNLGQTRDGTLMARAAAGSAVWVPLDRWGGRTTARAAGNATGTRVLLAYGAEYAAARHAELTAEPAREAAAAAPPVEWPVVDVPELAPIDAPEAAPAAPDAPSLWPEVIAATLALAALGGLANRFGETRPKRRRKRR